jgi:cytochrome P450
VATYPSTGLFDILRLAGSLVRAGVSRGDKGEVVRRWLDGLALRHKSPNVVVNLLIRRVLLVCGPDLSAHVLAGAPSTRGYGPSALKRKAMSFLAPHALTLATDDKWRVLRRFNEEVLQTGRSHQHQQETLALVRRLFSLPVADIAEIRQRMGELMLDVVFGEGGAPRSLIRDIQTLFAEVGLRTALIGSRRSAERDRFRAELVRLWRDETLPKAKTLLSLARTAAAEIPDECRREEVLADQIPQWMFTFTGSGSDLLACSLALILARPEVLDRVRREIDGAGPLDRPENIHALRELEACILEAGRLYPPVRQTAHSANRADTFEGVTIPSGAELLHVFAFTNRDLRRDATADRFRPERWLDPAGAARQLYPNLFLSGARACPGRDLILFIIKAAAAEQLRGAGLPAARNRLSSDPLPLSFPKECFRFRESHAG